MGQCGATDSLSLQTTAEDEEFSVDLWQPGTTATAATAPILRRLAKHTCFPQGDIVDYLTNLRARFGQTRLVFPTSL